MVFAPQGKHTLSHRVFVTIFVCAMAVIVAFTVLGAFFVQNTLADATSANLAQETELIAAALDEQQEPIPFLRSLDREDLRITLINKDGSVAYDNEASPSTLPNHGDRPEVIEAFESGLGSAERASSTLDEIMLYRAVALDNGQVVRLAQAQPGVAAILLSMVAPMLLIAAAGAVLSFFMARRESRAIIAPLQEVDLDHPRRSYEHAYAEMVPMLERIESQRQELKRQMAVLADNDRMRREFTANITHELKTPLTAISGYAELIANVHYFQIDGSRSMTPAALLSALQEMAISHSDSLGFSVQYNLTHHCFWSVVNWHLKLYRMPKYNETITLQTWSDKFARFQANRSFFLFDENGNKLLDGISRWIFMDSEKRKPANVPADMVEKYHSGQVSAIEGEKFFMPKTPAGRLICTRDFVVTRRDTDTNGHANNVKYLEWVMDDIPDAIYEDMTLKDIRIVYRKECLRGDTVTIKTYLQDTENGKEIESFLYEGETIVAQVITLWA